MYVDTPTTMHRTWRHDRAGRHMVAGGYSRAIATTACGFAASGAIRTSIAPKSTVASTFAKALNARPPRRGVPPH